MDEICIKKEIKEEIPDEIYDEFTNNEQGIDDGKLLFNC